MRNEDYALVYPSVVYQPPADHFAIYNFHTITLSIAEFFKAATEMGIILALERDDQRPLNGIKSR